MNIYKIIRIYHQIQIYIHSLFGIDILGEVDPESVGLNPLESYRSVTVGRSVLKKILIDLKINESDSIVDIGCGKGAAMIVMNKFPFKKIDGIEISKYIADIAIANFRILKLLKKTTVYNIDASNFIDFQNYNMFYLCNPFSENILSNVIKNILQNIDIEKEVIIIYNIPNFENVILQSGHFNIIRSYLSNSGHSVNIYSSFSLDKSRFKSLIH